MNVIYILAPERCHKSNFPVWKPFIFYYYDIHMCDYHGLYSKRNNGIILDGPVI